MPYELDDFCADCRKAYDPNSGQADLEQVRKLLEGLLSNRAFVAANCGPDAEPGVHTLYHDPDHDFMVLAHIFTKGRTSPPHDHGASWAIYGQAVGYTDMTEYRRLDDGARDGYAEVELVRKYRLEPGKAGTFGPHDIHSIHFPDGARFVRVTGTDLGLVETLRYDMKANSVTVNRPNSEGRAAGDASV